MRIKHLYSAWMLFWAILICPLSTEAHFFRLYAGTNEELKERVEVFYASTQVTVKYRGEYYGQLAPHIRFMMDVDQNETISPQETQQFIQAYQQEWERDLGQRIINLDNLSYKLHFMQCEFSEPKGVKFMDPLVVTLQFASPPLEQRPFVRNTVHLLEISQQTLFEFGRQFILMAKYRATFSDEQEDAIVRFCQVSIRAEEQVEFIRSYPGYIGRQKNVIKGIFYDNSLLRAQFSPVPKISATFLIHPDGTPENEE